MVLFFKLWFIFFIANLFLGSFISVLASDPNVDCPANPTTGCPNPNTTFFETNNVTGSSVTNPDVDSFYRSQFPDDQTFEGTNITGTGPPENGTGGSVDTIQDYFSVFDFLNAVGESFRFLSFINPFYTFDVAQGMFASIGVPIENEMMLAMKAIFFFLGILAFIFVIFKIDLI